MKLKIVGKTSSGDVVVSNLFKFFDTYGLPLEDVFLLCKKSDLTPSWLHFYQEAVNGGWTHETIINRLSTSIFDAHGKEYCDIVIGRLDNVDQIPYIWENEKE